VQERDRILHKFPDLIDQHVEELATLDTVDSGKLFLVGKVRDIAGGGSSGGMRGGEGREKETAAVAAMVGRGGAGRVGGGVEAGGGERVGPTDRGRGEVPSIEGMERSF
jgi:hypothetical protein